MQTPSQIVAEGTLARLRAQALLTEEESRKLGLGFAEGKLKAEDWRLAFENSSEAIGNLPTKEEVL